MNNSMEQTARSFFEACEGGEGWQVCSRYCKPDASFGAQAEALADVTTLEAYTDERALYVHAGRGLRPQVLGRRRQTQKRLRLCSFLWDAYRGRRPLPADREERPFRLRVRDVLRGRQDRSPDEDLEFWVRFEGDWLALAAADHGRSSIQPRGLSSRFDNYVLRFHRVSTFGASRRSHQVK